jgi:enoyl-CoA hydratase/carnithine racemase
MAEAWISLRDWEVLSLQRLPDAGVARIVLGRPEKRNALSHQLIAAYLEALEEIRADKDLLVAITVGSGSVFSAGLDLRDVAKFHAGSLEEWDRATPATRLYETVRTFPRIMIAQVHGYCLGGAVALLSAHDLAVAAADAQIGMPEIIRGSFGQNVTAALLHAGLPMKKFAMLQLSGRNLSGEEADRLGLVSAAVPAGELEAFTVTLAREIASRHPAVLQHAKIAVHLGRDIPLPQAMEVDRLVTARLRTAMDPTSTVDDYLGSQKGGTNTGYRRSDGSG